LAVNLIEFQSPKCDNLDELTGSMGAEISCC